MNNNDNAPARTSPMTVSVSMDGLDLIDRGRNIRFVHAFGAVALYTPAGEAGSWDLARFLDRGTEPVRDAAGRELVSSAAVELGLSWARLVRGHEL